MEQLDSQLPAANVVLDAATLDRIDEIIRPGVNLNPADTSYGEQVLQPALRRRSRGGGRTKRVRAAASVPKR
jgi:hypothetical protein